MRSDSASCRAATPCHRGAELLQEQDRAPAPQQVLVGGVEARAADAAQRGEATHEALARVAVLRVEGRQDLPVALQARRHELEGTGEAGEALGHEPTAREPDPDPQVTALAGQAQDPLLLARPSHPGRRARAVDLVDRRAQGVELGELAHVGAARGLGAHRSQELVDADVHPSIPAATAARPEAGSPAVPLV
jgi:hypothetical protein